MIDKRSKYSNRIIDESVNRGVRSKLNAKQMEERIEFHAHRKVFGSPTIKMIAANWMTEYGISMNPQSEKEWALNNKELIDNKITIMLDSGQWEAPAISTESLSNTIVDGAKQKVEVIKIARHRIKAILSSDFDKMSIDDKKSYSLIAKNLAAISKSESDSLVEMIKIAGDFSKSKDAIAEMIKREAKILIKNKKISDKSGNDDVEVGDIIDVADMDSMRKAAGIE